MAWARARAYLLAVGGVVAVTAVAWVIPTAHDPAVHRVVYVLAIATTGAYLGRGPAIACAVTSLAAADFLFVEPRFSMNVAAFGDVVTLLVFLTMGLLTGNLAGLMRDRAETARRLAEQEMRLREETVRVEVLRRTDELRHGLLRAVSHDLRSPLAAIKLAAGSLRDEWPDGAAPTPEEVARHAAATQIEADADRLARMVTTLLDLSRIESGALVLNRQWRSLEEVVLDTVAAIPSLARTRKVVVEADPEAPPALVDYVYLQQAISNLLENAARYAPPGTPVTVRIGAGLAPAPEPAAIGAPADPGDGVPVVEVRVIDHGPGVPEADRDRIFDPFYRVTRQRQPRGEHPQGAGYGLAVCAGFVQAHGGTVRLEETPGGGATFVIAIPTGEAGQGVPAP